MSETDPYAAPDVEEAKVFEEAPEAPKEATEEPVKIEEAVPTGSIKEVLAWVGDDAEKAQKALDAENSGDKRSSLISKLESIIN